MTINNPLYAFRNICIIVALLLSFVVLIHSFGWKKDNNYLKKYATRSLVSILMTYIILLYSLGMVLGFTKGFLSHSLNYFKSFLATIIIIVEIEAVRYLICRNSFDSKKPIIIFTILSCLINVLLEINITNLETSEHIFIFVSTIVLPIIAQETICSYLTYKISFLPSLIFKATIKLYVFIIPIIPNLGDYIYSSINIIFPYIIYMIISKNIARFEKVKTSVKKSNLTIY